MKAAEISVTQVLRDPVLLLATGIGIGLLPFAPGTFGTLVGVLLYIGAVFWLPAWLYLVALIVLIVAGFRICDRAAKKMGQHDHPAIVWDEIAGYGVTMIPIVLGLAPNSPVSAAIAGFVVFRFFDIVKPWPVSAADRHVDGGLGVMLDDLMAAVYAVPVLGLIGISGLLPEI